MVQPIDHLLGPSSKNQLGLNDHDAPARFDLHREVNDYPPWYKASVKPDEYRAQEHAPHSVQ